MPLALAQSMRPLLAQLARIGIGPRKFVMLPAISMVKSQARNGPSASPARARASILNAGHHCWNTSIIVSPRSRQPEVCFVFVGQGCLEHFAASALQFFEHLVGR